MKQWTKFLMVLLALICMGGLLLACNDETPDEPEEPQNLVDIIKDGETSYKLIRNELSKSSDPDVRGAVMLNKALIAATGAETEIFEDYEKDDEGENFEILIGKTNRPESALLPTDLERNEFFVQYTGKKLLVYAVTELGYERAVDYIITTYFGYDAESDTYKTTDLAVPVDLNYRGSFEYPPTVYLIGDIKYTTRTDSITHLDIARLISSLQGRLNKVAKENGIYLYWTVDGTDNFWLEYISGKGKLLDGYMTETISNWNDFWDVFGPYIMDMGIVLWDPDVPATANVAATICSVEGYLPVRFLESATSLYSFLDEKGVPVKMNLVDMFTGEGTIPDTDIPSTGSIKCDPYLWALEKYGDRCNSEMIAYALDGASCTLGNPIYEKAQSTSPQYNQLYSHDYLIYNECFFIDLTCTNFEKPCDDPDQALGTDAETLHTVLKFFSDKNNGKMGRLMGFPPWYMKYTTFLEHGSVVPTTLEWEFVEVLSQYNFIKEADAAHPAWMTNGSVYCQYQPTQKYENNEPEDVIAFDENVRYFTIYMGDYDSSAWMKEKIPTFFADSRRGDLPLMWAFNPNLSDRVPMIFDYVYENATENDYFVTGDSGAGYVIPALLPDLDAWVDFNEPYLSKFDMDIVGFIINGNNKMTEEIFAAYAEIAPVGSFHNDSSQKLTVYNGETVYMHLMNGITPTEEDVCQKMYNYAVGTGNNFSAYRTVVQSPTNVLNCVEAYIEYANAMNDGYTYVYVDPYTLFDLVLQSGQGRQIGD